jgi:hypothetical protein
LKASDEVVTIQVPLSPRQLKIERALAEMISLCLKELKKTRPSLEMDHLDVDHVLLNSFLSSLSRQLEAVWHTLG